MLCLVVHGKTRVGQLAMLIDHFPPAYYATLLKYKNNRNEIKKQQHTKHCLNCSFIQATQ